MIKRITGIFLVIILIFVNLEIEICAMETPDELKNLYARSAVLMDADGGRILFGKNEEDILPMASTTKIMTCILALENMKEQQIGIVSEEAVRQPKVHLGMKIGERYFLKDLLYSLMLESHNDSAVVIAEAIGGTVEKFADMMNEKAKEIGCINTYFITPNGLDAENETGVHATTAADLALIMSYCIQKSPQKEAFLKITQTGEYQFTDAEGNKQFSCHNHNAFLGMMEEAISGKTGYTNDAGYCYVAAIREGDRTFVVALLACGWPNHKGYKWQDTKKLMTYGLENYEYQNIVQKTDTGKVYVKDGVDSDNNIYKKIFVETTIMDPEGETRMLLRKSEEVETRLVQRRQLEAPVRKGEITGSVYYMLNGSIVAERKIVTVKAVDKIGSYNFIRWILKAYCL